MYGSKQFPIHGHPSCAPNGKHHHNLCPSVLDPDTSPAHPGMHEANEGYKRVMGVMAIRDLCEEVLNTPALIHLLDA